MKVKVKNSFLLLERRVYINPSTFVGYHFVLGLHTRVRVYMYIHAMTATQDAGGLMEGRVSSQIVNHPTQLTFYACAHDYDVCVV